MRQVGREPKVDGFLFMCYFAVMAMAVARCEAFLAYATATAAAAAAPAAAAAAAAVVTRIGRAWSATPTGKRSGASAGAALDADEEVEALAAADAPPMRCASPCSTACARACATCGTVTVAFCVGAGSSVLATSREFTFALTSAFASAISDTAGASPRTRAGVGRHVESADDSCRMCGQALQYCHPIV